MSDTQPVELDHVHDFRFQVSPLAFCECGLRLARMVCEKTGDRMCCACAPVHMLDCEHKVDHARHKPRA